MLYIVEVVKGLGLMNKLLLCGSLVGLTWIPLWAQDTGTVHGTVTLVETGEPIHGAVVLVVEAGQLTLTDMTGEFIIENIPPGTYEILSQREHLRAERQTILVAAGKTTEVKFELDLSPIHEEVTVTATIGDHATTFDAFNAITTLDSFDLVTDGAGTLGEALQNQPGVWKRSFGPGSSRPIIRGFDGDRVLIMEDGVRTGDLSSQSGEHGVTIDPSGLDRIEIVRGPATLLYGSNAVGGVINTITPHESYRDSLTDHTRGQWSVSGGTANQQLGTAANISHTQGQLRFWAGSDTRRTKDYNTPDGTVKNSSTRLATGRAGIGYFGNHLFTSGGVTIENSRYGLPFAGKFHGHDDQDHKRNVNDETQIDFASQRRTGRLDIGLRNLDNGFADSFHVVIKAIDWHHDELEIDEEVEKVGTTFTNRMYIVRAEMDQRQTDRLSGKAGVWAQVRNYTATGEEALAPATDQTAFAAFLYEELSFGRHRLQFGGRVERNAYTVGQRKTSDHDDDDSSVHLAVPVVRNRHFMGTSASVGVRTELGTGSAFITNLTRSVRAPALEELYNFGPHVGNQAFEVGNPNLQTETTLGLDLSLRHQSGRLRGNFNLYAYDIDNFVYASTTTQMKDQLRVAKFLQDDSRFVGLDAEASVRLGARVWANLGIGLVNAELTRTNQALPRIPPMRGQLSFDLPYRNATVTPEWIVAAKQRRVSTNETTTDGYSLVNLKATYVWPRQHLAHVLSVSGYNLTNERYRHHTSFIKDLAAEIGRGVKVTYSVRFF